MKKLTSKHLRIIRDIIIVIGMVVGLLLWFRIPEEVKNAGLLHVGRGEIGVRNGTLLLLLCPLLALIPDKGEEIKADNPKDREALEEEFAISDAKRQIMIASLEVIVIWLCMIFGISLG